MPVPGWIRRALTSARRDVRLPVAGLHAWRGGLGADEARLHLRVHDDGGGLLVVNAARFLRLTPPGVVMVQGLMAGDPDERVLERLAARFDAPRDRLRDDLLALRARLVALADADGRSWPGAEPPDDPSAPPLEVWLPAGEGLRERLDAALGLAVPHVTLVAADAGVDALVEGVRRAEDVGLVCGVYAAGSTLAPADVERLAAAGLDCLHVPLLGATPPRHDDVLGAGDHAAALAALRQAAELGLCGVGEIPVVDATVDRLGEVGAAAREAGAAALAVWPVLGDDDVPAALQPREVPAADAAVEVFADAPGLRVLVRPAVRLDPGEPLAARVRRGAVVGVFALVAALAGTLVAALAAPRAASAQNYRFEVPEADLVARIAPDASVQLDYRFVFANAPGAHPVDIVDIGMPNADYRIDTVRASCQGVAARDVRPSEYVKPGVEIHCGDGAIAPGTRGEVLVSFRHDDLVFADTTRDDLASFRITPTWFGDQFVEGTTNLKVAIVFPPGVTPESVLHQGQREFANKAATGEGTTALFAWDSTPLTGSHLVGVSFPIASMKKVVRVTAWQLLVRAVEADPGLRAALALVAFALAAIAFFRFSGGTGCVVFLLGAGGIGYASAHSVPFQILAPFALLALLVWNEVGLRKRKGRYLPPVAEVEGGGIKRGLTAPEAAVILEEPLGKVLALVVFGLLKKGLLDQLRAAPLSVRMAAEYGRDGGKVRPPEARREAARKAGVPLRPYEDAFLTRIDAAGAEAVLKDLDFGEDLQALVEQTVERMAGFDLSDTQEYYRRIVARARKEAEEVVDLDARGQEAIDRGFDWILLAPDADDLFRRRRYRPSWERTTYGGGGTLDLPTGGGSKDPGWSPTVGDAAGSWAGRAESTFGELAGAVLPKAAEAARGGFLDLSGVDRVTGEVLKAMAENSSGSGRGGGGGGCACACAGCACACACAGGGR